MFLELRRLFHNTKHGAQHNPKWRSNSQYDVCNVMVLLRHSPQGLYLYSKVGTGLGCGRFYVVFISRHFVLAGGTTNGYNYTLLSIGKGGVGFSPTYCSDYVCKHSKGI